MAWATGKLGGAVSFDGVDDYVNIGNMGIGGNGIATISVWISRFRTGVNEGPWSNTNFLSGDNNLYFRATNDYFSRPFTAANTWTYITVTYSGDTSTAKLYVNGLGPTNISQQTGSHNIQPLNNFYLGKSSGGENLSGLIDDARVYDRVLSPAEIMVIYNATK